MSAHESAQSGASNDIFVWPLGWLPKSARAHDPMPPFSMFLGWDRQFENTWSPFPHFFCMNLCVRVKLRGQTSFDKGPQFDFFILL